MNKFLRCPSPVSGLWVRGTFALLLMSAIPSFFAQLLSFVVVGFFVNLKQIGADEQPKTQKLFQKCVCVLNFCLSFQCLYSESGYL